MSELEADVVVVGGGPAGSATALLLARAGCDVLLLERATFPREKPCGEYLSPGTVGALDRLGALDAVRRHGPAVLDGMHVRSARAGFLMRHRGEPVPFAGLGVSRAVLDSVLLEQARGAGARVLEGCQVLVAETGGDGRVTGVRVREAGAVRRVRCRFVVAADGRNSAITRTLGLDLPVRWPRRLGLVARYEGTDLEGVGQMHVGDGTYCGLAPVGAGQVTAGLVVPMGSKPANEPTVAFFERQVELVPGVTEALGRGARVTPVRGAAPLARRVSRAAGSGFLLVGDAAGFLDPFTGEGIFRALRGAELACEFAQVALARRDACPAGYEQARREAFADKERMCLLVQGFLSSGRTLDYALRRMSRRPRTSQLFSDVLGDVRPAAEALRPRYLATLLRP